MPHNPTGQSHFLQRALKMRHTILLRVQRDTAQSSATVRLIAGSLVT
jgi:hypothetical protein